MSIGTLRNPGFRAHYLGSLMTLLALWMLRVVLAWLAWDLSASAGFVGLVAGLTMVPSLITGPVFGVLTDRSDILLAARWTAAALTLSVVTILIALLTGGLGSVPLVLAALGFGVVTSAHHPVRMSLGPRLVPREMVPGAVALDSISFNVARLVAPVLAGVLIAKWGASAALTVTLLFTLPMLGVLPRLSPRPLGSRSHESVLRSLGTGIVHATRTPIVFISLLLMSVFTFAVRGVLEILPAFADGVFLRGASGLGLMTGTAGAGALLASLLNVATPAHVWKGGTAIPLPVVAILFLGQGGVAVLGLVTSWPAALATVAALGFFSTLAGVSLQTVVQSGLDDALRGRVMSLWIMTGFGFAALGASALGVLIDTMGRDIALPLAGLVSAAVTLVLILRAPACLILSSANPK